MEDPCGRCQRVQGWSTRLGECTIGNRAKGGPRCGRDPPALPEVRPRTGDVGRGDHGARATPPPHCTGAPAVGYRAAGAARATTAQIALTARRRGGDRDENPPPWAPAGIRRRGEGGWGEEPRTADAAHAGRTTRRHGTGKEATGRRPPRAPASRRGGGRGERLKRGAPPLV